MSRFDALARELTHNPAATAADLMFRPAGELADPRTDP